MEVIRKPIMSLADQVQNQLLPQAIFQVITSARGLHKLTLKTPIPALLQLDKRIPAPM